MVNRPHPPRQNAEINHFKETNTKLYQDSLEAVKQLIKYRFPFVTNQKNSEKNFPMQIEFASGEYIQYQIYSPEQKIRLPYIGLIEGNTTETGKYNKETLRQGIKGILSDDKTFWWKYKLVPVQVDIELIFVTQSLSDIHDFKHYWFLPRRRERFSLINQEFEIECAISWSESLETPQIELDGEGQVFTIRAGIILETYLGSVYKQASIQKHIVATNTIQIVGESEPVLDYRVEYSVDPSLNLVESVSYVE